MKVAVILIVNGALDTVTEMVIEDQEIRKDSSKNHPDTNIIKIGQNTEKSPGELRILAISQNPGKCHQLTLV